MREREGMGENMKALTVGVTVVILRWAGLQYAVVTLINILKNVFSTSRDNVFSFILFWNFIPKS